MWSLLHVVSFSRKKSISDGLLKWKSLSDSWHILVATGMLDSEVDDASNTTKFKMLQHTKKAASNCKCNVSSCAEKCDCPDGFRYQLLKLHGECECGWERERLSLSLSLSLSLLPPLNSWLYTHHRSFDECGVHLFHSNWCPSLPILQNGLQL